MEGAVSWPTEGSLATDPDEVALEKLKALVEIVGVNGNNAWLCLVSIFSPM